MTKFVCVQNARNHVNAVQINKCNPLTWVTCTSFRQHILVHDLDAMPYIGPRQFRATHKFVHDHRKWTWTKLEIELVCLFFLCLTCNSDYCIIISVALETHGSNVIAKHTNSMFMINDDSVGHIVSGVGMWNLFIQITVKWCGVDNTCN